MRVGFVICALLLCAACNPEEERDRKPFVPDTHGGNNTTSANNTTNTSGANNTSGTNHGTTATNSGTTGADHGEYVIALDAECEDVPSLTGSFLLLGKVDTLVVNMADVDPDTGMHTNPRELTVEIDWPADPVALCYPEYDEAATTIPPRVGIFGLTIRLNTPDGELAESFDGAAWLSSAGGQVGAPSVAGSIFVADMNGSYMPGAEVLFPDPQLSFFTTLEGPLGVRGNIAMSRADSTALSYGSFTGRQIVIEWPYEP